MPRTLSDDVHLVGDTLGDVLRAHGGDELFHHVETMRRAAKRARESGADAIGEEARARLAEEAQTLAPSDALEVARAFMLYFQIVNVAEDVQRARALRQREIEAGPAAIGESLHEIMVELDRSGATGEQVLEALSDVQLSFVFTSHPTEARRRTTERLLVRVRESLEVRDRMILTPTEQRIQDRRLRAAVEALWEHSAERRERPEVLEEVKAGLWYLRHVLLDAVPRVIRRLAHAYETRWGAIDAMELPMPIHFGSWMGGDRDGNPYVNDAVTERTLELQRWIVLDRYAFDLESLADALAASAHRLPDHAGLDEALARAAAAVPEIRMEVERRNPDEPLRRMLSYMHERIVRTRAFAAGAYNRAEDFVDDLLTVRDVLRANDARALPDDALLDLLLRVRCFGFVLAALDVREDSRVHREVVGELLGDPDYPQRDDAARRQSLASLKLPPRGARMSAKARRVLDSFEGIRRMQARFGPEALSTYVISMAESPADVLEVLRLAELHRVDATLDVAPLLETPEALASAGAMLEGLLSDPDYRRHVERRLGTQELLVGYSDSMKMSGMLASRVLIRDAQCAAASVCARHGVTLRVFHGRGGSVSRGGGPTYRAIRSLPRDAFSGKMKITEQGETRAFHFAHPDLAVRYLEQTVGAAIVARYEAIHAPPPAIEGERAMLARLAEHSREAYRDLTRDEGLVRYFRETTPLEQIAALNIASRPSRRGRETATIDDLRAIPYVFAWSQSRHIITGWYGVGYALAKVAEESGGLATLTRLYREAPFFRDVLDNVQMVLAKSDMPIAARYAGLCTDDTIRERIFGKVERELERTRDVILRITGQKELLDDDPMIQRSIRLRNPYVDPLSYLQLEALRRIRAREGGGDAEGSWESVARVTVQGVAAGLRNTG